MNKKYPFLLLIILAILTNIQPVFSWGTDQIITYAGTAQHSIAAKQNGVLYSSVPVLSLTGQHEVQFFNSTNNGTTWTPLAGITAPYSGLSPVIKTKMVVTSLDSIICLILQNDSIYLVNVESGITGILSQSKAQEFDAAAGAGNFIYLFVQEMNNNDIRRYGTGDGGITWTGNTALVTGSGYLPRVTMSGPKLILNYYGPVLADTVSSVIRAADYNEGTPGNITPGTFINIVTNTAVKKKQFQSVFHNGVVWFFFTEGDAQEVLKCIVSLNFGGAWQPEQVVAGNAQVNARWFDAAPYTMAGGSGVALTYLADSLNPVTSAYDKMIFSIATVANPTVFNVLPTPFNTYNDTTVIASLLQSYPAVVNYSFGGVAETGIAWTGLHSSLPSAVFFDRLNALTGLNPHLHENEISIYPNPATHFITVGSTKNQPISEIKIYDVHGRLAQNHPELKIPSYTAIVRGLSSGIYMVKVTVEGMVVNRRVVIH